MPRPAPESLASHPGYLMTPIFFNIMPISQALTPKPPFILDLAIQAFVELFIKGKNLQAIYTTSGDQ